MLQRFIFLTRRELDKYFPKTYIFIFYILFVLLCMWIVFFPCLYFVCMLISRETAFIRFSFRQIIEIDKIFPGKINLYVALLLYLAMYVTYVIHLFLSYIKTVFRINILDINIDYKKKWKATIKNTKLLRLS